MPIRLRILTGDLFLFVKMLKGLHWYGLIILVVFCSVLLHFRITTITTARTFNFNQGSQSNGIQKTEKINVSAYLVPPYERLAKYYRLLVLTAHITDLILL